MVSCILVIFLPTHLRVFITTEGKLQFDETNVVIYPLNMLLWPHPSTFSHKAIKTVESSRTIGQLCDVRGRRSTKAGSADDMGKIRRGPPLPVREAESWLGIWVLIPGACGCYLT